MGAGRLAPTSLRTCSAAQGRRTSSPTTSRPHDGGECGSQLPFTLVGCAETLRLAGIPSHGSPNKACICPRAARPHIPPRCASPPNVGSPSSVASHAPNARCPPSHPPRRASPPERRFPFFRRFSRSKASIHALDPSQASTSVSHPTRPCSTTTRFEERAGRGGCALTFLRRSALSARTKSVFAHFLCACVFFALPSGPRPYSVPCRPATPCPTLQRPLIHRIDTIT